MKKDIIMNANSNDSCVKRSVEIVRLALGYRKESSCSIGSRTINDIVNNAHSWFPRHKIHIWANKDLENNIHKTRYEGDQFEWIPNSSMIYLYGYKYDDKKYHMVVGNPIECDMSMALVIGIDVE